MSESEWSTACHGPQDSELDLLEKAFELNHFEQLAVELAVERLLKESCHGRF